MAQVTIYEVEGRRVAAADVDEITELRCDGCGEFLAAPPPATGSVSVVIGDDEIITARFDAHLEHAPQALADVMRRVAEHVQWPPAF